MLLNLASVANADDPAVLWGFIARYAPGTTPETSPRLAALVAHAIAYYRDFVAPTRRYRAPTDAGARGAGGAAPLAWPAAGRTADAEAIQYEVYEIGKRHGFANLRDWFRALYEVLLGQSEGPRFGTFVAIYGVPETCSLIEAALAREAGGRMTERVPKRAPAAGTRRRADRCRPPQARPGQGRGSRARRPRRSSRAPSFNARQVALDVLDHVLGPEHRGRSTRRSRATRSSSGWPVRDRAFARLLVTTVLRRLGPDRPRRAAAAPLPAEGAARSPTCCGWARRSCCSCRRRPHAAVAETVRLAAGGIPARGADAQRRAAQARGRRAATLLDGQDAAAAEHAQMAVGQLGRGLRRGPRPARSPRRIWASRRSTCRCMRDAERWASELGAEILPTGTLRRRSGGLVEALPGFDEGVWWVQDAAAALPALLMGAAEGQARARHRRRTRRQDGPARAMGAKVTALERSPRRAEFLCRNLGRADARCRDRRRRRPRVAATGTRSTPSCWTRPAPPPAPSAATRTSPGPSRRPTSSGWPRSRAGCCAAAVRMLEARRRAGLRRLLAAARGGAAADRGVARGRRLGVVRDPIAPRRAEGPAGRPDAARRGAHPALPPRGIGRARRLLHRTAAPPRRPDHVAGTRLMPFRPIRRALLSVHDKTGLVDLARRSPPSASSCCRPAAPPAPCARPGLAVTEVSEVTGAPEILDGRVKTLHPGVHGGILARRDLPEHMDDAATQHGLPPIDLVVVNLYPFEATLASGADFADCIEQIDVGGPAMIRAAAKNHDGVAVLVDPGDYAALLAELRGRAAPTSALAPPAGRQGLRPHRRLRRRHRRLARPRDRRGVPRAGRARRQPASSCCATARTRTSAPPSTPPAPRPAGLAAAAQLQGKELSFNNLERHRRRPRAGGRARPRRPSPSSSTPTPAAWPSARDARRGLRARRWPATR